MNKVPSNRPETGSHAKALVVDPSVSGQSHLLVNTGFIRLLLGYYEEIVVVAHDSHCQALKAYLAKDSDLKKRLTFIAISDQREFAACIISLLRNDDITMIFFLNLGYRVFLRVNLRFLFSARIRCFWVLHAHLHTFKYRTIRNQIKSRMKVLFMIDVFSKSHVIVLGERIRQNLLSHTHRPLFKNRVHAVFHPMGVEFSTEERERSVLKFPFSIVYSKGWHEPSEEYVKTVEKLAIISRHGGMFDFILLESSLSRIDGIKKFRDDYFDRLKRISTHDFMLFLPHDDYSLQASGTIMDSVVMALPVIGIRTDFADEVAKNIGEFGCFFEGIDQLVNFLSNVDLQFLAHKKSIFQENLASAKIRLEEISKIQLQLALKS